MFLDCESSWMPSMTFLHHCTLLDNMASITKKFLIFLLLLTSVLQQLVLLNLRLGMNNKVPDYTGEHHHLWILLKNVSSSTPCTHHNEEHVIFNFIYGFHGKTFHLEPSNDLAINIHCDN
ncbi:hypothetical protein C0J52_25388 [Blattella germanica]|nr:hypothetical protein C0J52_25388 [Blattella germanica]